MYSIKQFSLELFIFPDFVSKQTYASLTFSSEKQALIVVSNRLSTKDFLMKILVIQANEDDWNHLSTLNISNETLNLNLQLSQSSHMQVLSSCDNSHKTSHSDLKVINIVFGSVYESKGLRSPNHKSRFCTILHWFTIDCLDNLCSIVQYQRLVEDGLKSDWPKFVHFDNSFDDSHRCNILVASEGRMKFELIISEELNSRYLPFTANVSISQKELIFNQTSENVCLCLNIEEIDTNLIKTNVDIKPKYLEVCLEFETEHINFKGELEQSILPEESEWKFVQKENSNNFEIKLKKYSKNVSWQNLFLENDNFKLIGCSIIKSTQQEALDNRINENKGEFLSDIEKYSNQLEDIDQMDEYTSLVLTNFQYKTGEILSEYDLSSQQFLFSLPPLNANKLPYIGLRNDVDAFLYSFGKNDNPNKLSLFPIHMATFNALGFIQASKVNKRFMTLCQINQPDVPLFTYAFIADSENNIYLYWFPEANKSYQNNTGFNFILHIEDSIEGIHALKSNNINSVDLFVVSINKVYFIQINPVANL